MNNFIMYLDGQPTQRMARNSKPDEYLDFSEKVTILPTVKGQYVDLYQDGTYKARARNLALRDIEFVNNVDECAISALIVSVDEIDLTDMMVNSRDVLYNNGIWKLRRTYSALRRMHRATAGFLTTAMELNGVASIRIAQ